MQLRLADNGTRGVFTTGVSPISLPPLALSTTPAALKRALTAAFPLAASSALAFTPFLVAGLIPACWPPDTQCDGVLPLRCRDIDRRGLVWMAANGHTFVHTSRTVHFVYSSPP